METKESTLKTTSDKSLESTPEKKEKIKEVKEKVKEKGEKLDTKVKEKGGWDKFSKENENLLGIGASMVISAITGVGIFFWLGTLIFGTSHIIENWK